MYNYKCVFYFGGDRERYEVKYGQDGIHAFINGFWITYDLKFTKGSDCKYWIPPSQILYVEKVEIV